jgi:hypothetical protein
MAFADHCVVHSSISTAIGLADPDDKKGRRPVDRAQRPCSRFELLTIFRNDDDTSCA